MRNDYQRPPENETSEINELRWVTCLLMVSSASCGGVCLAMHNPSVAPCLFFLSGASALTGVSTAFCPRDSDRNTPTTVMPISELNTWLFTIRNEPQPGQPEYGATTSPVTAALML